MKISIKELKKNHQLLWQGVVNYLENNPISTKSFPNTDTDEIGGVIKERAFILTFPKVKNIPNQYCWLCAHFREWKCEKNKVRCPLYQKAKIKTSLGLREQFGCILYWKYCSACEKGRKKDAINFAKQIRDIEFNF